MGKKKDKIAKTNAIREIERAGIDVLVRSYDISDGLIDGPSVASKTGVPQEQCFKTLVAKGDSGEHYVFVIPVFTELDLKKAASHFHEKKVSMIHVRDLLPLTGYQRGGCSPVGMKKHFPTVINESAKSFDEIAISGGKKGIQIMLSPQELAELTDADFADLVC